MKQYEITTAVKVKLTEEDIDDIMCSALEGGITYWCRKAEVAGEYLGEWGHEQIARGGTLVLCDAESSDKWELTLDKFLAGVKMWLESGGTRCLTDLGDGRIDTCNVDGYEADSIVQYALFGELVFG